MIIGITGIQGSGKSTVAKMFNDCSIIDVDKIAHRVLNDECHKKVIHLFGNKILNPDLSINRPKLREIVYNDKTQLTKLENILHPVMINEIEKEIKRLSGTIIIDAALLFKMGLNNYCDKIITIITKREITKKLKIQTNSDNNKLEKSDYIIQNNNLDETRKLVNEIWEQIKQSMQDPSTL